MSDTLFLYLSLSSEGLLTVTSQQNVDNKQTTLRVMGAQQNDQNLNHTSRSTTRAVPSTELAEVSTSRRTTDEYSTAIMTTETTVSTTIQQHKSTTDTPTIGIHTTELEPLQQTPSEESTIIADSLTKQRQESTTYTPSVTASQEPLLSRRTASTPVNTLLSTAETLLDHSVPLTVEVETPYTTIDTTEGSLTVTPQLYVDNKQTTLRVMGTQQNDQNLNHTSRSTTRAIPSTELAEVSTSRRTTDEYSTAIMTTETTVSTTIQHKSTTDTPTIGTNTTELEPLQQTPSEERTIIAASLTKQQQESTTYTPSVTASQEPLLSRQTVSTPVNTLLSTAETLLDHSVPLTVEVATPYTTVDTTGLYTMSPSNVIAFCTLSNIY
ncbi:hypothetical protein BSL78_14994 [Apostichopus japonicus]|uniref:Uncharacterized protein n=1 Tax=Stichopus japonicus TaxID=307972 RepID=A0A2G8KJH2_STIJA|nr:hypothetical protein BSL78_14994 [Apostichopus japonicus]